MPRRGRDYAYPIVHPPSTQPHPPQPQAHLQPGTSRESRFSWIGIKEPADGNLSPTRATHQASVPPLPNVPDHLHNSGVEANAQRQQNYTILPEAYQMPEHVQHSTQPTLPQAGPHNTDSDRFQGKEAEPLPEKTISQPVHDTDRKVNIAPDQNPLAPENQLSPDPFPNATYTSGAEMTFAPLPSPGPKLNNENTQGGTWRHSLYSCAEPSVCMTGIFCPCIIYGRTQYRLNLRSERKDPTNMLGYKTVNGSCAAWSMLCGVNILLSAIQHTRIRKSYQMDSEAGNVASDCLKSLCCCCCMLAQDEKEVQYREAVAHKENAKSRTSTYMSPTAMTFRPPP